jgi:pimeloyl-ACP methyl ester carboxylesterase
LFLGTEKNIPPGKPKSSGRTARRVAAVAVLLVAAYLGVCAFIYMRQARFIFAPNTTAYATPGDFDCTFEELTIGNSRLHGYWLPGPGAHTVIYHHGNSGNVTSTLRTACNLNRLGFNVLTFDYRGYGSSEGDYPSEQSVYEDADAVWAYVTKEKSVAPLNVILHGFSLGAAVAIESAIRHPEAGGLIAESGFTSICEMGLRDPLFRWLPLSLLVNQQLDSIVKVPRLAMPVLFIHGTDDPIVPAAMAESLHAAAPQPKQLLIVKGGGHGNLADTAGEDYARAILSFAGSLQRGGTQ